MHQICTERTVRYSEAAERNGSYLLRIVFIVIHWREAGELNQLILDASIELISKVSVKLLTFSRIINIPFQLLSFSLPLAGGIRPLVFS